MIQIKRGKTENWRKNKVKLASGQPGYDKDKHKLKIGDGKTLWKDLPYASGLSAGEILCSEKDAKRNLQLDPENKTIITYGTEDPNKDTVGQIYMQYYDSEPEVDYVVSYGIDGIWTYRKWHSGVAECWGTLEVATTIQNTFENKVLYFNNKEITCVDYPITFEKIPCETASVQSASNIVWLAGKTKNTKNKTGEYVLISPYHYDNAKYKITMHVIGFWK